MNSKLSGIITLRNNGDDDDGDDDDEPPNDPPSGNPVKEFCKSCWNARDLTRERSVSFATNGLNQSEVMRLIEKVSEIYDFSC